MNDFITKEVCTFEKGQFVFREFDLPYANSSDAQYLRQFASTVAKYGRVAEAV